MKSSPERHEESKARYLTNDKKRYYLASVDENVQMLVNSQKEELTRLLIDLKSEYDTITRETRRKKEEEDNLKHKIFILDLMAKKTKKNMDIAENTNETMKNVLEVKRKRKEEEMYTKKTLMDQIDKFKLDTLLLKKEILQRENESKRLTKQVEKGKLTQNDLKERYNGVYSRITEQNQRNRFDNNEQSLQLQYYTTIIEQKSMFIQSADERKERQIRITQEAKNNSADQMEESKRKQFELLLLYNKYLRNKMEQQLSQNAKMEETFQEIRDISGSEELSSIVDIILTKDKHYNFSIGLVTEQEKSRDQLKKDIDELNCALVKLKTELPVYENREEEKTISPVEIGLIEEEEKKLLREEEALRDKLYLIEEKHRGIDLVFNKVIENVYLLCSDRCYLTTYPNEVIERDKEEHYITTGIEETNVLSDQNKTTNVNDGINQTNQEGNLKPDDTENNKEPEQLEQKPQEEQPKGNEEVIGEVIKEEKEGEGEKKDEEGLEVIEKKEDIDDSIPQEYEEVITKFNVFLTQTLKRFHGLFLCHSKLDFLKIMREKGMESRNQLQQTQSTQQQPLTQTLPRKQTRKATFLRPKSYKSPVTQTTTVQPVDPMSSIYKGEMHYEKDEPIQNDERVVFKQFVEEMKRNREDFIKNGLKKE